MTFFFILLPPNVLCYRAFFVVLTGFFAVVAFFGADFAPTLFFVVFALDFAAFGFAVVAAALVCAWVSALVCVVA
jgi:hypothetical protein